jgi:nucleotide-binding universal stress UspA family protein
MKTIIAPTDFSGISLNAVNYAADMALDLNAELVIAHVADLSSLITSDAPGMSGWNYDEEWSKEQLSNLQKKIIERTKNKIAIRSENLRGSVFHELKTFFDDEKPFSVVMATHSPSTLERIFFQSVTLYTAKHIKYPVLIIPAKATYNRIKNIGLACDLETVYHEPLEVLRDWISVFNASLHVLHVKELTTNEHFGEMMLTRHYLKEFNPKLHFIENNDSVEKSIFSFANENSIDLLVIIPKKHKMGEKSELKKFVFHPQLPLMALQPQL